MDFNFFKSFGFGGGRRDFKEEFRQEQEREFQKRHTLKGFSFFEDDVFKDIVNNDAEMKKVNAEGSKDFLPFTDLVQDLYSALYRANPELNRGHIEKPWRLNRNIVEKIMQMDEFAQLRNYTRLDREVSTSAAIKFANRAIEMLPEEMKEEINKQYKQFMKMQAGKGKKDGDNQGNSDQDGEAQQGDAPGNPSDSGQNENDQFDPFEGMEQSEIDEMMEKMTSALSKEAEELIDNEEMEDMAIKSFGQEDGALNFTPVEQKMEIMRRLQKSRMLQEVVKIAGRLRDIAKKVRVDRKVNIREENVDVITGNDILSAISSELALMDNEGEEDDNLLEDLFCKKLLEWQLLQNRYEGKEDVGKGPIVMLIDRSGSMEGEREIWSKGAMLAMQMIAKEDKRDFYVAYYDNRLFAQHELINGAAANVAKWMEFVSIGADGGTNFEAPLNWATKVIAENVRYNKADIIMVSDGECSVSDQFLKNYKAMQEKLNFKTIGILIGPGGEVMKKFCDLVVNVNDFIRDEKKATDVMFSV